MGEIISSSYIPYGLDYYGWKPVAIGILNRGTMISHKIEIVCLIGDLKEVCLWKLWS